MNSYILSGLSFVQGAASILDIGGTVQRKIGHHPSDFEAISHDWEVVGDDIQESISRYEKGFSRSSE